jgi:hypothetical protein
MEPIFPAPLKNKIKLPNTLLQSIEKTEKNMKFRASAYRSPPHDAGMPGAGAIVPSE